MADRIPKMSLKTVDFRPVELKFADYTPQFADMNILANSIKTKEARDLEADKKTAELRAAFGELDLALEEDAFKENYINNVMNQLNVPLSLGDSGEAIRRATQLASQVASDPQILGRTKYNTDRKAWIKSIDDRVATGTITKEVGEMYKSKNKYDYQDTYKTDENGNKTDTIIGGTKWEGPNIAKHVETADIQKAMASQLGISSSAYSSEGADQQVYYDKDGNETTDVNAAVSLKLTRTAGSSSGSTEQLTVEQLVAGWKDYITANPNIKASLKDDYDAAKFTMDKLEKEAASLPDGDEKNRKLAEAAMYRKQLIDANPANDGTIPSLDDYCLGIGVPFLKHMAYKKTTTGSKASGIKLDTQTASNKGVADAMGANLGDVQNAQTLGSTVEEAKNMREQTVERARNNGNVIISNSDDIVTGWQNALKR